MSLPRRKGIRTWMYSHRKRCVSQIEGQEMSVGDEDEDEEVMSELEESVEEDEDDDEVGKRGGGQMGKNGQSEQQIKKFDGIGGNNGKNVIKGKEEKKSDSFYPLSPYRDGGEEEEQEYSSSFYPNDSLNQSTVSYRSKLSLRSNKMKNKLSKDEDDYDAYSKTHPHLFSFFVLPFDLIRGFIF
jgi:hypothetical protein